MAVATIDFVVSDAAAGGWVEDNDVNEVAAADRAGYVPRRGLFDDDGDK
jgi:post-segregation antitoxin (ccd killing protein)